MDQERIYLDHAATTPPAEEVIEAMLPFLREEWGNPSSPHARGRNARTAVDDARDRIAAVLGCAAREVIFTAGGTEADNLALRGAVARWGDERGRHLVVSAIEHEGVLATAHALVDQAGCELTEVGCDSQGRVDPAAVAAAVRDDTVLVSLMVANNEIGTQQEVSTATRLVRERNPHTLVHSDAVQALGRIPVGLDRLGVDLLSVSAHKCYGPKGIGALLARWGAHPRAQVEGGGQERGRRSGTENVAAIAGFAVAAELVVCEQAAEMPRQAALRDALEALVIGALAAVRVASGSAARLPNVSAMLVDGASTEALIAALDIAGVEVSGGSACASGAVRDSHVLRAIGEDPRATALIRCSLGRGTTQEEVRRAAASIVAVVGRAVRAPAGARP
ncbi:MAG: cysteine desulfurase [Candidatus Dormibacteraeota bacterium]|uniref:cysteine desulfurase n=1 Tax=Candidatus Amunia macphersoniae TaxID=3127014 RepID=A0A934NGX5_9BACT|nr:cysteine desulfurase [Candidatus Dormibacteraeota bacterium]